MGLDEKTKCSVTSYFSPSLVTLHGLIHLTSLKSPGSQGGVLHDLCTEGLSELCLSQHLEKHLARALAAGLQSQYQFLKSFYLQSQLIFFL